MSNDWSALADAPRVSIFDRLARRVFLRQLDTLRGGEIVVHDAFGSASFGETADLRAECQIRRPQFFREAVLGGSLAVARSYFDGDWDCDDLTALFRIFIRNMDTADAMDRGWSRLWQAGHRLVHRLRANTRAGSRQNIEAHYDLGNEFFRLWLDQTMAYSSGIFRNVTDSLQAASLEKFDRVCRKLDLQPHDHLLEIGCGWGGFALHAATHYGCRVTATTISRRQFDVANERIAAAGLDGRITLLLQDYRDLEGKFDKVASIEMIEAVGYKYLDAFFRQCGQLLWPDGVLLLQAIVMPERRYRQYLRNVDFIQRYVFPGGCLPSVAGMLESAGRTTSLRLVHCEDFAPHYAETLRRWRHNFHSNLTQVRDQGCSPEFIRLWDYYLAYCEAVFAERYAGVVQIQFDGPACRRDPLKIVEQAASTSRFSVQRHEITSGHHDMGPRHGPTCARH